SHISHTSKVRACKCKIGKLVKSFTRLTRGAAPAPLVGKCDGSGQELNLVDAHKIDAVVGRVGQHQHVAHGAQQGDPLEHQRPGHDGDLAAEVALGQGGQQPGGAAALVVGAGAGTGAAPAGVGAGGEALGQDLLDGLEVVGGGLVGGDVPGGGGGGGLQGHGGELAQGHLGGGDSGASLWGRI